MNTARGTWSAHRMKCFLCDVRRDGAMVVVVEVVVLVVVVDDCAVVEVVVVVVAYVKTNM